MKAELLQGSFKFGETKRRADLICPEMRVFIPAQT